MKFEMTERDKKLLVFLSVFVIVVCIGYWGVYPVIKDINKTNEKIQTEKDLQDMNELKVSQLPMIEAETEKMEEEILVARQNYYEMMTSDEIDKHFTGLALSSGLYLYDLNISVSSEPTSLSPYQYSEKALNEEVNDYEFEDETDDDEEASEDEVDREENVSIGIYTSTISLKVGGDEKKLISFLDSFCNTDKKLRVVNYSFSEERSIEYNTSDENGEGTEGYEIKNNKVLSITFEIYMCEE